MLKRIFTITFLTLFFASNAYSAHSDIETFVQRFDLETFKKVHGAHPYDLDKEVVFNFIWVGDSILNYHNEGIRKTLVDNLTRWGQELHESGQGKIYERKMILWSDYLMKPYSPEDQKKLKEFCDANHIELKDIRFLMVRNIELSKLALTQLYEENYGSFSDLMRSLVNDFYVDTDDSLEFDEERKQFNNLNKLDEFVKLNLQFQNIGSRGGNSAFYIREETAKKYQAFLVGKFNKRNDWYSDYFKYYASNISGPGDNTRENMTMNVTGPHAFIEFFNKSEYSSQEYQFSPQIQVNSACTWTTSEFGKFNCHIKSAPKKEEIYPHDKYDANNLCKRITSILQTELEEDSKNFNLSKSGSLFSINKNEIALDDCFVSFFEKNKEKLKEVKHIQFFGSPFKQASTYQKLYSLLNAKLQNKMGIKLHFLHSMRYNKIDPKEFKFLKLDESEDIDMKLLNGIALSEDKLDYALNDLLAIAKGDTKKQYDDSINPYQLRSPIDGFFLFQPVNSDILKKLNKDQMESLKEMFAINLLYSLGYSFSNHLLLQKMIEFDDFTTYLKKFKIELLKNPYNMAPAYIAAESIQKMNNIWKKFMDLDCNPFDTEAEINEIFTGYYIENISEMSKKPKCRGPGANNILHLLNTITTTPPASDSICQ